MLTSGPFGDADGAKSDLNAFIPIDYERSGAGRADEEDARVVVGAKGSGKTIFLRRLQTAAKKNAGVFADSDLQQEIPSTEVIVRFAEQLRGRRNAEEWRLLWHRAILRSVISHIAYGPFGETHLPSSVRQNFDAYDEFTSVAKAPCTVYSQIGEILRGHDTEHQVMRYLTDPLWIEVEHRLFRILEKLPPLYFFIDSLDDSFQTAPKQWLQCQRGMLDATLNLLRYNDSIGGRIHIVVAIRDVVFSSALDGEHRSRYSDHRIKTLSWDFDAIHEFLERKIEALPDREHLMAPNASSAIERWLGASTIVNVKRGITEDLATYLLRHTRLLPRDVILLGNELSARVRKAKGRDLSAVPMEDIRDCVSDAAKFFGGEQLAICANEIASMAVDRDAALRGYHQLLLANQEYLDELSSSMHEQIRSIGSERFGHKKLDNMRKKAEPGIDTFDVLWRNRLLGYRDLTVDGHDRDVFFSVGEPMSLKLPYGRREYVFHSCLIDTVGIRSNGKKPTHGKTGRVR